MSESYVPGQPSGFGPEFNDKSDEQGKAEAAKHEASQLKDTGVEQAANVAETAKDEAANVMRETKSQVKDLYAQTQSEIEEQAGVQQQRVASGLHAIEEELASMASNSESQGLASDLVCQVSDRAGSVASWLDSRDPGSLLAEVKSYARQKPGMFIAVAGIAGLVAGRLTRSLVDDAADAKDEASEHPSTPVPGETNRISQAGAVRDDAPLYSERASALGADHELLGGGQQR